MRTSRSIFPVAVVFAFAAAASFAQAADRTIARLVGLRGSVLVAGDSVIASVDEGSLLRENSRVLTTANAAVVVEFDGGCRVRLGRNQRFVVSRQAACPTKAAAATSIAGR
jgi:hypothetical protein